MSDERMDAKTEVIVCLFRDTARVLGLEATYLTGEPRFEPKQLDVVMRYLYARRKEVLDFLGPLDPDALERALEILKVARDSDETRGKR